MPDNCLKGSSFLLLSAVRELEGSDFKQHLSSDHSNILTFPSLRVASCSVSAVAYSSIVNAPERILIGLD